MSQDLEYRQIYQIVTGGVRVWPHGDEECTDIETAKQEARRLFESNRAICLLLVEVWRNSKTKTDENFTLARVAFR